MKKTVRYFLVLVVLSGIATAFAGVGDHTKPTGGRQDDSSNCQIAFDTVNVMPTALCAGL
jgi:hypothetical protein